MLRRLRVYRAREARDWLRDPAPTMAEMLTLWRNLLESSENITEEVLEDMASEVDVSLQ